MSDDERTANVERLSNKILRAVDGQKIDEVLASWGYREVRFREVTLVKFEPITQDEE